MSSAPLGATPERDILERVTVIIVTYQSVHCLDAQDPLLSVCPHVILIDNGSDDGTLDVASARWPHARIMALKKNYGFGAANNLALRHVNTPCRYGAFSTEDWTLCRIRTLHLYQFLKNRKGLLAVLFWLFLPVFPHSCRSAWSIFPCWPSWLI